MPLLGSIIKRGLAIRKKIISQKFDHTNRQEKVLKKLLVRAEHTMFGEAYRFSAILESPDFISGFRNAVPVHDYNSIFASWWNKCLHGKQNVCWPGRVKYFALSSGTSDSSSKHIPVTKEMVRSIQRTSIRQIFSLSKYDLPTELFEKGILMLGGSTHLHHHGSYFEGDLSGITASKLPFWFQHFYKPGRRIARETNWAAKLDEITLNAPKWDIGIVVGVPAWVQLLLEKVIAHYDLKTIHDVWPNLSIYVHGGVSFEPYKKSFEPLLAKPLTTIETYLASEGFIAFQNEPGTRSMQLVTNNGLFFEFIPFNEKNFTSDGTMLPRPQTLLLDEIEEGQEYALLLSSNSGAWRYLIGDVIKFTSKENCEIVITGRTRHFLSLCGEHLSIDNMNKAIEMVADEMDVHINEFVVSGIPYGTLFAHKWYVGTDQEVNKNMLRQKLDDKLKILNDDYRVERSSALKDILVEVVPTDFFYNWLARQGKVGAQNKFPRVMKGAQFSEWEKYVERELAAGNW